MTGSSNMISDDFSDGSDDAPLPPPKVPADARKIPPHSPATVYAPTSDKKPLNPDPLQRPDQATVAAHHDGRDFGERLLDC
ncbi:hypothetical protein [Hyphomicrobium sp. MC1]|uniref:hypothetical protein n=1 Tax=Hyphomicrobium sp. (strain MC1) TaxID=717785 RepID=UPI000213E69E|nr:hypothetical protein [Hyphomicrobium sp. MC1]CCB66523.1 protein of unknown function [Hyphomicrobium sp. MC1]